MRVPSACTQCRTRKVRCRSCTTPGVCQRCSIQGLDCSLSKWQRLTNGSIALKSAAAASYPGTEEVSSPLPQHSLRKLVESYLRFIHDRPHSIFHHQSLWTSFENESIPNALLYSICSLGAHVCPDIELRSFKTVLAKHAKRCFWASVENVCVENVQTCILLANIAAADHDPSSEVLFFGIATRIAQLARINVARSEDSILNREIKCRIWWSLVMADHWCSHGVGIARQLDNGQSTVPLPLCETTFQKMTHSTSNVIELDINVVPGIWAYKTTLVQLLGQIHDFNRGIMEPSSSASASAAPKNLEELSGQLRKWLDTLPWELQLTDDNLIAHQKRGLGGTFVALHLGYHHYATLLYFHCLDDRTPSSTDTSVHAVNCRYHAVSFSELLLKSRGLARCEAIYATVGHMTIVSSCVLLHNLLFGPESELYSTREHLTSNFEALVELKEYWPCLEQSLARLLAFQQSCSRSLNLHTHRMDNWLVRFLLEHSACLPEKRWVAESTPAPVAENISEHEAWTQQALARLCKPRLQTTEGSSLSMTE